MSHLTEEKESGETNRKVRAKSLLSVSFISKHSVCQSEAGRPFLHVPVLEYISLASYVKDYIQMTPLVLDTEYPLQCHQLPGWLCLMKGETPESAAAVFLTSENPLVFLGTSATCSPLLYR